MSVEERARVHQPVEDPKRILIVCELDGYANGQKPVEIERFLRSRGHDVRMANALFLGRASDKPGSLLRKLPSLHPKRFVLYLVELASIVVHSSLEVWAAPFLVQSGSR